jgi:hypothetical protein
LDGWGYGRICHFIFSTSLIAFTFTQLKQLSFNKIRLCFQIGLCVVIYLESFVGFILKVNSKTKINESLCLYNSCRRKISLRMEISIANVIFLVFPRVFPVFPNCFYFSIPPPPNFPVKWTTRKSDTYVIGLSAINCNENFPVANDIWKSDQETFRRGIMWCSTRVPFTTRVDFVYCFASKYKYFIRQLRWRV